MITLPHNSRVCPSPETVRKYLEGWTDDASSKQIEEHLSHCDACANTVETDHNPSDQWLQAIRSETQQTSSEVIQSGHQLRYEDIDPVAQQAIESSKRMLLDSGASAPSIHSRAFSKSVATLGEIGPYELIRPIGQGGMGYVMLARHKHLDKEVAVKILPSTPWQVPSEEARFQREIRAVGKLEHPSIVTALDAGKYQGTHFLAMEYVDGLDLSRLAKALGPLSIPDACELVRQTALGLSYAHSEGIVHRDVKPSNLMLDRTGKVKILDFGLAQLQPWDDGCADLTSVGQLMGTLDYMAPEQAEHGGAVSYRADLYSLGATLFRLLVGRAPLAITPTQTPIEKLRLLSNHPIPHLKTMLPDVPDGLCSIVDSLLARDPSQRPPSAAHLAELLEPWAKGSELVVLLKQAQNIATQIPESPKTNPNMLASQRFDIPSAASNESADSTKTASATNAGPAILPGTRSVRGRNHGRWILWTAAGLLAPLAALGGFLIYLETQKGQVVVESEVAEVRVRVVSDGKEIDDVQLLQGVNSIRLRAGKYELLIDSPTDSITMSNHAFILKKGETIVARIRRTEQPTSPGIPSLAVSPSPASAPRYDGDASLNVPQYNGKTLQEWLIILGRERAFTPVFESLEAITGLATKEDRESIRKPLETQIQRFSDNHPILSQALEIEKRISTNEEFESRLRAILKTTKPPASEALVQGGFLRLVIQDDRVFAESLMSLEFKESEKNLRDMIADVLGDLLLENSEFNPDDLGRYCDRVFSSESARKKLVNPTVRLPAALVQTMDSLVLRVLQSRVSAPTEQTDAMSYLINPESLARVRKEAVVAIEQILVAMSNDEQIRFAETPWYLSANQTTPFISERGMEYDSMFGNASRKIPFSIAMLRIISATNLATELAPPLRELAKSCLNSIQPVALELLTIRMSKIKVQSWESNVGIYSLKSKPVAWKMNFFTFHAALRLLQSNKLAEINDFVLDAPTVNPHIWARAFQLMSELDSDRSGDLDKDEFMYGDFTVADKNSDGFVTDVEYHRYSMELEKQQPLGQAAREIQVMVVALNTYKLNLGAFPSKLDALWKIPDDFPDPTKWVKCLSGPMGVDPWGTPYQYSIDGPSFKIRSSGSDRQENTDDDITNRE